MKVLTDSRKRLLGPEKTFDEQYVLLFLRKKLQLQKRHLTVRWTDILFVDTCCKLIFMTATGARALDVFPLFSPPSVSSLHSAC